MKKKYIEFGRPRCKCVPSSSLFGLVLKMFLDGWTGGWKDLNGVEWIIGISSDFELRFYLSAKA